MVMDPEEHDSYVAAISHLPLMAATALYSVVRASQAWPELSLLAANGFKDPTRPTELYLCRQWIQRYNSVGLVGSGHGV